ncbi:ion transporter [Ruania alba]|uniref:Voltage-gated sodium channel n=1 Tax=Ruania alba TaxID=648782 RepID=A0A1H5L5U8_9MICO|nr:ion transporter [Ruania alba]SEE72452.1 voltage-gated sodium channel [Ruania alba]
MNAPSAPPSAHRLRLAAWVESRPVQRIVVAVIVVNAITLGLETFENAPARVLHAIDLACLIVFVVELSLKLYANGLRFFRSSWNVFDLLVVVVALVPGSGGFAVLRALRVLRVLRLISAVPRLRQVVGALMAAVPGMLSIGALLGLLFYVSAVMATMLFADTDPERFGTLWASLFSLFQIMTLDSWSALVLPIMTAHPWAWMFFVPFVLISAFAVLNLFIAVIVDSMQHLKPPAAETDEDGAAVAASPEDLPDDPFDEGVLVPAEELGQLRAELAALRGEVSTLTQALRVGDASGATVSTVTRPAPLSAADDRVSSGGDDDPSTHVR